MGASQQMLSAYTSTAAGVTYATWNPSDKNAAITLSGGNLATSNSTANVMVRSTLGKSTGKWYWEVTINTAPAPGDRNVIGVANSTATLANYPGGDSNGWGYYGGGQKLNAGLFAYGSGYTAGDVIGVALDMTAGTITFYKNNASQGQAFSGLSGTLFAAYGMDNTGGVTDTTTANFGASALTYSPPAGFNAGLYV